MGLCSESEKKAVEEWFNVQDDSLIGLKILSDEEFEPEGKVVWSQLSQAVPELAEEESHTSSNVIPLYKKFMRYAAAACILFATFLGGRFSAGTVNAHPVANKGPKDLLYVYGENGSYAEIEGEKYEVFFNGRLKLSNGSAKAKVITSGSKEYQLEPFQTILLTGSHHDPGIISQALDQSGSPKLKGDFSVRVVRDQP